MALWVDKYRPLKLSALDFHQSTNETLQQLASSPEIPHLLFYGPSGAGKKTRIMATLREIYGPSVEKLSVSTKYFQTPSGSKLSIHLVASNYHTEMTPSDVGIQDRLVVQEIIKEIAQTQQIDSSASRRFKVVIINEADRLSKDAQHGLRRTMEKYMGNLRIVFCCESTSKIISPIRSRCLLIRVAAPDSTDIKQVLTKVASKEGVTVAGETVDRIAEQCGGNLRKALLMLEAGHVQNSLGTADVPLTDWEMYIKQIAGMVLEQQTPQALLQIRTKLYELIAHCIPADIIMKQLAFELLERVDATMKRELIKQATVYEHRLRLGNKPIFHLEAFVAKFMSLYKRYLMDMCA